MYEIKAKVWHLHWNPGNKDGQMIQTEREELSGLILQLKDAQQSAGVVKSNLLNGKVPDIADIWDDFINKTESNNSNIIPVKSSARD